MRKGAGVERARIVARHCIHPSRVRSGLRMTRKAPVDPLSHSVVSRVKPLSVAWTISTDSIVPAVFATGAECVKCSADFGLSVTSRLLDSLMKSLHAGRSVRLWINWTRTLQITRSPGPLPAFWCEDGHFNSCLGPSIPTVACCSRHIIRKFWNSIDCSRTESRFRRRRVLMSCCHLINNYSFRFSERRPEVR